MPRRVELGCGADPTRIRDEDIVDGCVGMTEFLALSFRRCCLAFLLRLKSCQPLLLRFLTLPLSNRLGESVLGLPAAFDSAHGKHGNAHRAATVRRSTPRLASGRLASVQLFMR